MNQYRNVTLRPVTRGDLPTLLRLFGDTDRFHLWGSRRVCDEEQLLETWRYWSSEKMSAKFTVLRNGKPVGVVFDYERSVEDGHSKVAAILLDEETGRGTGVIALTLFAQWLFRNVPLRKVYLEVFEFNEPVVAMLRKMDLKVEMQRASHRFWNGKYWGQIGFAFYRDDLSRLTARILRSRRIVRQPNETQAESPATHDRTLASHDAVLCGLR